MVPSTYVEMISKPCTKRYLSMHPLIQVYYEYLTDTCLDASKCLQADSYRFSRCKAALPMTKMRKLGLPLPANELDTLGSRLAWEDIQVQYQPTI